MTTAPGTSFANALYGRADVYFSASRCGKYATPLFWMKAALLLLLYAGSYIYFVFFAQQLAAALLCAFILGLCHVFIPVNLSHDAIHNAVSARHWVNRAALRGFDITGSNSFMYREKHLEAHRDKENGSKAKGIEVQALLLSTRKKGRQFNLPMLSYLFYAEYMIFFRDFILYARSSSRIHPKEVAWLVLFKLLYMVFFLLLPFVFSKLAAWQMVLALVFMYTIVTLVLVIILLMPTEKMENQRQEGDEKWVTEILEHNVDFSPRSYLLNQLAGGANLNVVHYLFPGACHVHYTGLAAIIEQTAAEYGLLYRKQELRDVFGIHFNYLKNIQQNNPREPVSGAH